MTHQSEHKFQAMFWPLQTAGRERNSFLQTPQKCYIGNSKMRWLVQRESLQWLQMIMMHWKGSPVTSQQQAAGSNSPGLENLPVQSWISSFPWLSLLGKWFFLNVCLADIGSPALVGCSTKWHGGGYCLAEVFHSLKDVTMSLGKKKFASGSLFFKVAWSNLTSISKAVTPVWYEWQFHPSIHGRKTHMQKLSLRLLTWGKQCQTSENGYQTGITIFPRNFSVQSVEKHLQLTRKSLVTPAGTRPGHSPRQVRGPRREGECWGTRWDRAGGISCWVSRN